VLTGTKNKKFNRAEEALLKAGMIRIEGTYIRDNTLSIMEIADGHVRDKQACWG
jgi:glutamate 5-kinase